MRALQTTIMSRRRVNAPTNLFWALGPNVTGYVGGFPNGLIQHLRRHGIWGARRLHVCAGAVDDPEAVTVDVSRAPKGKTQARPSVQADAQALPFRDGVFDFVLADPPYSEEYARKLFDVPLLSVPKMLAEMARVTRPGGLVALLDLRVWVPPRSLRWTHMIAVYVGNMGPTPLRCLQVWRKRGPVLESAWNAAES